jgi:hypothetical protein
LIASVAFWRVLGILPTPLSVLRIWIGKMVSHRGIVYEAAKLDVKGTNKALDEYLREIQGELRTLGILRPLGAELTGYGPLLRAAIASSFLRKDTIVNRAGNFVCL